MADPIFVRSPRRYASYTDFWRLVELSGFQIVNEYQIDFGSDSLYVWAEMDADFMLVMTDHPKESRVAKTAFWNIETPDKRASSNRRVESWWYEGLTQTLGLVDYAWVSDKTVLDMDSRAIWARFGSHPDLRDSAPEGGEVYDVAHIGQLTPRRERVITELKRRGISVSPPSWGADRARVLSSSKLLLDIQQLDGMAMASPIRWAVAAAYRIPIIREGCPDFTPLVPGESILWAPLDKLADAAELALTQDLTDIGSRAWAVMCQEHTFRSGVEEAVRRSDCEVT